MRQNLHAPCSNLKSFSFVNKYFTLFLLFVLSSSCQNVFANIIIESNDDSSEKISIILSDMCDNVTHGGKIEGDEAGCTGNGFDPSLITSSIAPSGGTGNLEYLWMKTTNDPTSQFVTWTIIPGSTSEIYDPIPITQTTHYIRCARREGCTDYLGESNYITKTVTCTENQPCQLGLTISPTNTTCGEANGAATAIPTLGLEPYSYNWSNGGTSATINGLNPGMYTVTVTDAEQCIILESVEIFSSSSSDITVLLETTDSNCGSNNGSITATASGGNSPYSYLWSNGATSATIDNLAQGTYTVTATNANGCSDVAAVTIIDSGAPQLILSGNDPSCGEADGSVNASVTGGSGNYTYSWSDGSVGTGIPNLFGGEYCVTVTDDNACQVSDCIALNIASNINVNLTGTDPICGATDGAIASAVSGGNLNYSYSWSNGETSPNINNLSAGEFCVTVTDTQGCEEITCITLNSSQEINVNLNGTDATCGDSNGSANATVSGGSGNVTYNWDNGGTGAGINNLSGGTYCVTINDTNGCEAVECITINETNAIVVNLTPVNPSCESSDGEIVSVVSGGNLNYSYAWTNGQTSSNINNLSGGEYCVTVTDTDGCVGQACATLVALNPITIDATAVNTTCGESNGSIDLEVAGGSGNVTYNWDNGSTNEDLNNLINGTYCVTVTDQNSCTANICVNVSGSSDLSIIGSITDNLCEGDSNGGIDITVNGGAGNYTYNWDNSASSEDLSNLSAGTYCVTVMDTDGCSGMDCFTIADPSNISVVLQRFDPSCNGANDGSIDLTVSGGTGDYTYDWDNGMNVEDIAGLIGGTYCVIVIDENGCTASDCITLENPSGFSIDLQIATQPSCNGSSDASIDLSVTGAGIGGITYDWDNGMDIEDPNGLTAGTYCVTVTDNNGCTQSDCIDIADPDLVTINVNSTDVTCDGGDGSADVEVLSGAGGYTYLWDNALGQTNNIATNLVEGTYTVTVTDANGCTATGSTTISGPDPADCVDKINIGDYVWLDADMDGIQDADEMGVGNVMVKLVTAGNDGIFETFDDVIVATETTENLTGYYLFENVMPGTYIIIFMPTSIPNGSMFTGKDEEMDDALDSDAMPYTGATNPFTLVDGQEDDLSFDAGITYDCLNVISGGSICCDQEVCGAGGDPEPITSDVPASGGIGAIEYLWMKSTTGTPFSMENPDWMAIPDSNVEEYDPISVFQTTYFIRCARRSGCEDYSGESNIVIVKVVDCLGEIQGRFVGFDINENAAGKVDLSWQTNQEISDYKFIIETSKDGLFFEVLELVDGKSQTQSKDYSYTHASPRVGHNYYRIKHLSTIGNTESTEDKMLIMKKEGTRNMMLYPNPFQGVIQIEVLKDLEETAQLQVVNSFGQVIKIEQIPVGTQVYQLDMSEHSSGAYYVYIVYDGFKKIQERIFKLD